MLAWMMFFVIFVVIVERVILIRLERHAFRYRLQRERMSSGSDVARAPHEDLGEKAPTPRTAAAMGRLKAILLSDRAARWTARLSLIVIWQLVGELSDRMPTPVDTFNSSSTSSSARTRGPRPAWWNNQVVQNTYLTIERRSSACSG